MVSYRRSLYRQSTRGSSHSHKNEIEDHVNHYDRVWVSPVISTPGLNSNSSSSANASSNRQQSLAAATAAAHEAHAASGLDNSGSAPPTVPCLVKTWAMLTNHGDYVPVQDGDPEDLLDLLSAKSNTTAKRPISNETSGSLTAADIRGAVGSDGSNIAGYSVNTKSSSSSSDRKTETAEKKDEEKETKTEDTEKKADDDVEMSDAPPAPVAAEPAPETTQKEPSPKPASTEAQPTDSAKAEPSKDEKPQDTEMTDAPVEKPSSPKESADPPADDKTESKET